MDAIGIGLVTLGLLSGVLLVGVGLKLDRRDQRKKSADFVRSWRIRNRVLAELWNRVYGRARLEDRRSDNEADHR